MNATSLTLRVTMLLGVASVLILGAAAIFMDQRVDAEMEQRFDASLLTQARTLTALVEIGPRGLDMEDVAWPPSRLLLGQERASYAVRCADGSATQGARALPGHLPGWADAAPRETPLFGDIEPANGPQQRAVMLDFTASLDDAWGREPAQREKGFALAGGRASARRCRLLFAQPRGELDRILFALDWILLFTPMFALVAVLAISPLLVRRGLQPLARLGEDMREIGPAAPGRRLARTGTPELEPLVERFNGVLIRMDEGLARERQFAGALAHETRTRLAELRALVDIEIRFPSGRPLADVLEEIGAIGAELEGTTTALLLLTRLNAGIEQPRPDRTDPIALLERQLERHASIRGQHHLEVDRHGARGPLSLQADPGLLDIVIGNLVGNACAYAPPGDAIQVCMDAHGLTVENAAPDLEPGDVAHLGDRFWRKRPGGSAHAGLGLALARAAAAAMHMPLAFELHEDGRLRAILRWAPPSERLTP